MSDSNLTIEELCKVLDSYNVDHSQFHEISEYVAAANAARQGASQPTSASTDEENMDTTRGSLSFSSFSTQTCRKARFERHDPSLDHPYAIPMLSIETLHSESESKPAYPDPQKKVVTSKSTEAPSGRQGSKNRTEWNQWLQVFTLSRILEFGQYGANQIQKPSVGLLTAALLGKECRMDEEVGGLTFQRWNELGVCYQPELVGNNHTTTIPNISLMVLGQFFGSFEETSYTEGQMPYLRELLRRGFADSVDGEDLDGWFKRFHIYWENLRRSLLNDEQTFSDFYRLEDHQHTLNPSLGGLRLHFAPKTLGVKALQTSLETFVNKEHSRDEWFSYMYVCKEGDPVDSFYVEVVGDRQLLFVGEIAKYREGDDPNKVSCEYIIEKQELLMKTLFGGGKSRSWMVEGVEYTLTCDHVVLVMASFQQLPTKEALKEAAKHVEAFQVVLLDEDQLTQLYTPTLMTLPFLYSTRRSSPVE